jgi:hypothetical protein
MEYIITEKTEEYGWCLWRVCGNDRCAAERALDREQAEHPEKELRIETVAKEDCWWNDPKLCN